MERGGSAADAAVAAAAVLCVVEPMSTGIGGDAFALVRGGDTVRALDAAGPAPAAEDLDRTVHEFGPRSVTVPGAVSGWSELLNAYGRLGLDSCLRDAIDAAEWGFAIGHVAASAWRTVGGPSEFGDPPRGGQVLRFPALAASLRVVADQGPPGLYTGELAAAIAACSWLTEEDLAAYSARWVTPLVQNYRGADVFELPPPTQGIAVLEGLGLLGLGASTLQERIECVRLALEDAMAHVRDGSDVDWLLEPGRLAVRRRETSAPVRELSGGTVYVCAIDADGTAVSFIQSVYERFGSGVVAPGTGIVLQNRGACFAVEGEVRPGCRPYHTIIPGLLLGGDGGVTAFGVVGGFVQAQAQVQLVSALLDDGLDPQAALDLPRFRVEQATVHLEEGLWDRAADVERLGLEPVPSRETRALFGCGQAVTARDGTLTGGSDARGDGHAAGY
jgi:gamma-glutamyltranspeptidase/glutathione hydrolase